MRIIFMTMILCMGTGYCQSRDLYTFSTAAQQKNFQQLTYELRCLVCQNQNLAESNASLAGDLRMEIADKIQRGDSNQEIIHYMVQRYGDYVLYKPPVIKSTLILWFAPFFLLCFGLFCLYCIILKLQKQQQKNNSLTELQRQHMQNILNSSGE